MNLIQKTIVGLTALTTLASFTGCSRDRIVEKPFEVEGKIVSKKLNLSWMDESGLNVEYLINVNQDFTGNDTTYLFRTYDERARKFNDLINEGDIVTLKSDGYTETPGDSVLRTRYAHMWK
tara:strand:- start:15 stop:377 length:363 start_codon:yes stop_codon:yes gene_type:complete